MPSVIRHTMNPMPVVHPKTATAVAALLKPLTKGLSVSVGSSEGDEPLKTMISTGKFPGKITSSTLEKFLKLPHTVKLEGQSASKFFKDTVADWRKYAAEETDPARKKMFTDDANKLEKLGNTLKGNVTELQLFQDTNQDHVKGKVYIVGKAADGKLVGLQTTRIWT